MKWFKHMTNAHRDPALVALRMTEGVAGLGRWWLILEMIAEEMNESDRCEILISPGYLTRYLGFRSQIDCQSFLDRLANDRELISVQYGNEWLLKCSNLLKIRGRKNTIDNILVPQNKNKSKNIDNTPIIPKGDSFGFWAKYPKRNGKKVGEKKALQEWKKLTIEEKQKAMQAIDAQIIHFNNCKKAGVFVAEFPDCFRWLRDKRFNDDVETVDLTGKTTEKWFSDWKAIISHIEHNIESNIIQGVSERGYEIIKQMGGLQIFRNCPEEKRVSLREGFKNRYLQE